MIEIKNSKLIKNETLNEVDLIETDKNLYIYVEGGIWVYIDKTEEEKNLYAFPQDIEEKITTYTTVLEFLEIVGDLSSLKRVRNSDQFKIIIEIF